MTIQNQQPYFVPEYDISNALGACVPTSFDKTMQHFRDLINRANNGIPDNIRRQLAAIYNEAGLGLSSFTPLLRTQYTVESVENYLEHVLSDDFECTDVKSVKEAASITEETLLQILKKASDATSENSFLSENASEIFFENLREQVTDFIDVKIQEGALPMLERQGYDDYDLS